MKLTARQSWWIDCIAIFLLVSALVWPLYKLVYLNNWPSIESTFIADGRMLKHNLPHRQWQPYWYCGTRADYVYPPGLRYGTAILTRLLNTSPPRAYHIYIALFYCLGMVATYVLIRIGTGSRGAAWLGTIAVALVSPSFALMRETRVDSFWGTPQRLHVLMAYGEGPHISALSVLPFALAFALRSYRSWHAGYFALAGFFAALVVTNNFYGATALAILFPIVTWAAMVTYDWKRVASQAVGIALIAYGLTSSWLVPSYFRVTGVNLRMVAEPGNQESVVVLAGVCVVFGVVTWWIAERAKKDRAWEIFVAGSVLFMCLDILGHRYFGFQVAGESSRLIPELDLVLILGTLEIVRRLWVWRPARTPAWVTRVAVCLLVVYGLSFSARYLKYRSSEFPADHNWRDRPEYKVTRWLHENHPNLRTLATGSIRFWYNVWFDLPQLDGGSQQGLQNRNIALAQWRLFADDNEEIVRLWLQALATDIAVVPQKNSREHYHDITRLEMWHKLFPLMRDDGEGNYFYRIPRRCEGTVRLVDAGRMSGLQPFPMDGELDVLRAYVNAIEAEPPSSGACGRVQSKRQNTDEIHIQADVRAGEALLVQETFDAAWRAYVDGQPTTIMKDPVQFMLIHVPPGQHNIRVVFERPAEVTVGYTLSAITVVLVCFLIFSGFRPMPRQVKLATR